MTALYCAVNLFLPAFLTLSLNPFTVNAKIPKWDFACPVGNKPQPCPPPPDWQGGKVHALWSGLKLGCSASKAAVSAGVGGDKRQWTVTA